VVVDTWADADTVADRLFHALADATRRDIVRRVIETEQSVSGLARLYPMSTTAVQKHVAVLEEAGLVTRRRQGREQRVRAAREGLQRAWALLDVYEQLWRGRVDRMADLLAEDSVQSEDSVRSEDSARPQDRAHREDPAHVSRGGTD